MLKTSELLELTDEDLLGLIGTTVVMRLSLRPDPKTAEEDIPFKTVTAVGTIVEMQFSEDTGGAILYMFSGSDKPDEIRWDCDEYRADFTWDLATSGVS